MIASVDPGGVAVEDGVLAGVVVVLVGLLVGVDVGVDRVDVVLLGEVFAVGLLDTQVKPHSRTSVDKAAKRQAYFMQVASRQQQPPSTGRAA